MTFFMRLVNRISQLEGELRRTKAERDHYRQMVQQRLDNENEEPIERVADERIQG